MTGSTSTCEVHVVRFINETSDAIGVATPQTPSTPPLFLYPQVAGETHWEQFQKRVVLNKCFKIVLTDLPRFATINTGCLFVRGRARGVQTSTCKHVLVCTHTYFGETVFEIRFWNYGCSVGKLSTPIANVKTYIYIYIYIYICVSCHLTKKREKQQTEVCKIDHLHNSTVAPLTSSRQLLSF